MVGVEFSGFFNLLRAIKISHLQGLIEGNIGIRCAKSVSIVERFFKKNV